MDDKNLNPKILILDDEQEWSERIAEGFDEGFDIVCKQTPEEGIIAIETERPHFIICDSFRIDGWIRIHEAANKIPMILVTSDPETVKEIALAYEIEITIICKQNPDLLNELREIVNKGIRGEGESFKN